MSNPDQPRWSRIGAANTPKAPPANAPARPASSSRDRASSSQQRSTKPNAWTNAARSGVTSNATTPGAASTSGIATPTKAGGAPAEETYVPVNGFNGEEVEGWMKKGVADSIANDAAGAARYRPAEGGVPAGTKAAPWGVKPSVMGNGQDFWVQLKKGFEKGG